MDTTPTPNWVPELYIHFPILDEIAIMVPFSCAFADIGTHKANKGLDHEVSAWK